MPFTVTEPFGQQKELWPERIWTEELRHAVLITVMENGVEQRREKAPLREAWVLEYRRDSEIGDAIWAFYKAKGGPLERFNWYHPYDVPEVGEPDEDDIREVRFADHLTREQFRGNMVGTGQTFTIRLIELREEDT